MLQRPPHDKDHIPDLDKWHQRLGTYEVWMLSQVRSDIMGPKHHVRIVDWENLYELCRAAGLNEQKLAAAYMEAVQTGDILFVEYDEE